MRGIMREINVSEITNAVKEAVIKANIYLPGDLKCRISEYGKNETVPVARDVFADMEKNYRIAEEKQIPVCQDRQTVEMVKDPRLIPDWDDFCLTLQVSSVSYGFLP